jgi:mannosyl-oligosaccharide alpha-1,2-mannosidase
LIGYDLLQDDAWSDLVTDPSLVESLKEQVISLADSIKFAFDTPSGVPESTIILNPEPKQKGSTQNNLAEVGTLILEWTRLSDMSGNPEYGELAAKAESYLLKPTPESGEPFPGLTGTWISLENGTFLDGEGGWSGYTDSFYEYLIKMYLYDPEAYSDYKDRWIAAAESTIEHLASHPTSREDLTFLAAYRGTQRVATSGHCKNPALGQLLY